MFTDTQKKTAFIFIPVFQDQFEFSDYYFRAAWYLKPLLTAGTKVYFVAPELKRPTEVPAYLAPNLSDIADTVRSQLILVDSFGQIPRSIRISAYYLLHQASILQRRFTGFRSLISRRIINVDHGSNQYASSLWLKLTSNDGKGTDTDLDVSKKRFNVLKASVTSGISYIFGTGPSFDQIDFAGLAPGLFIATNSMVVNDQIMNQLCPPIIIASDPIFHAGPSKYAHEFRQKLISAMERHNSYFIFAMRDYGVYRSHLPPHLEDKLIPVPLIEPGPINSDLATNFMTTSTSNVMTLLLLPVAASLTRSLVLGGFDGRPLDENDYYWKHSSSVQITTEMESIQRAHPAFFQIDYDDYYFQHVEKVRVYLDALEGRGFNIVSITNSHVPAINSRLCPEARDGILPKYPLITIIMPNYNSGKLIKEAIHTILEQDIADWELIIVDDGSTDESIEIAHSYSREHDNIFVLEQDHRGVSAARNRGLDNAHGKYIAFLDSDDTLVSSKSVSMRIQALESNPEGVLCVGKIAIVGPNMQPLGMEIAIAGRTGFYDVLTGPAHLNGVLGRASVLKQSRFNEKLSNGEDWTYLADVARRGYDYLPVDSVVATYRQNDGSTTRQRMRKHMLVIVSVIRRFSIDIIGDGVYPPQNWAGLRPKDVENEVNCRYMQLVVFSVLTGAPAGEISALLAARIKRGEGITQCSGSIEFFAARVFKLEMGSASLRATVSAVATDIRVRTLREVACHPALRPLSTAIIDYLTICDLDQRHDISSVLQRSVYQFRSLYRRSKRLFVRLLR